MRILKFDGASRGNPGFGSCAAVLYDKNVILTNTYKTLGNGITNNQAEYMGLIAGLRMAINANIKELQVEGDSKLVIEHLFGTWECRHPILKRYYQTAKDLIKQFNFINGRWIPREQNKDADSYCNLALDKGLSFGYNEWFVLPKDTKQRASLLNYIDVHSVSKVL